MMLSPPYLNRTDRIQQDPQSLFCIHHPVTLRICVRFKALVQNSSPYSYSFAFRLHEMHRYPNLMVNFTAIYAKIYKTQCNSRNLRKKNLQLLGKFVKLLCVYFFEVNMVQHSVLGEM